MTRNKSEDNFNEDTNLYELNVELPNMEQIEEEYLTEDLTKDLTENLTEDLMEHIMEDYINTNKYDFYQKKPPIYKMKKTKSQVIFIYIC